MSSNQAFILKSIIVSSVISVACLWLTLFIMASSFQHKDDPGAYIYALYMFGVACIVAILSYIPSFLLMMHFASKSNKADAVILRPRRDFLIAVLPSMLLALLLYFLTAQFYTVIKIAFRV